MGEPRVLVVGDVIVDEFVETLPMNVSVEGSPTVLETDIRVLLGGAAFVARNLVNLMGYPTGSRVGLMTLKGHIDRLFDYPGMTGILDESVSFRGWHINRKRRYVRDGKTVFKSNFLNGGRHSSMSGLRFLDELRERVKSYDVVVLADNRHGVLEGIEPNVVRLCVELGKSVVVDSQCSQAPSNHHLYEGATVVLLNENEFEMYGRNHPSLSDDILVSTRKALRVQHLIVKRGKGGSTSVIGDVVTDHSAPLVDEVDPLGAGDCFLAAFVSKYPWSDEEAFKFANRYAAASVTYHGTTVPDMKKVEELR